MATTSGDVLQERCDAIRALPPKDRPHDALRVFSQTVQELQRSAREKMRVYYATMEHLTQTIGRGDHGLDGEDQQQQQQKEHASALLMQALVLLQRAVEIGNDIRVSCLVEKPQQQRKTHDEPLEMAQRRASSSIELLQPPLITAQMLHLVGETHAMMQELLTNMWGDVREGGENTADPEAMRQRGILMAIQHAKQSYEVLRRVARVARNELEAVRAAGMAQNENAMRQLTTIEEECSILQFAEKEMEIAVLRSAAGQYEKALKNHNAAIKILTSLSVHNQNAGGSQERMAQEANKLLPVALYNLGCQFETISVRETDKEKQKSLLQEGNAALERARELGQQFLEPNHPLMYKLQPNRGIHQPYFPLSGRFTTGPASTRPLGTAPRVNSTYPPLGVAPLDKTVMMQSSTSTRSIPHSVFSAGAPAKRFSELKIPSRGSLIKHASSTIPPLASNSISQTHSFLREGGTRELRRNASMSMRYPRLGFSRPKPREVDESILQCHRLRRPSDALKLGGITAVDTLFARKNAEIEAEKKRKEEEEKIRRRKRRQRSFLPENWNMEEDQPVVEAKVKKKRRKSKKDSKRYAFGRSASEMSVDGESNENDVDGLNNNEKKKRRRRKGGEEEEEEVEGERKMDEDNEGNDDNNQARRRKKKKNYDDNDGVGESSTGDMVNGAPVGIIVSTASSSAERMRVTARGQKHVDHQTVTDGAPPGLSDDGKEENENNAVSSLRPSSKPKEAADDVRTSKEEKKEEESEESEEEYESESDESKEGDNEDEEEVDEEDEQETVEEAKERCETELMIYYDVTYGRRMKAACRIQCAWRCNRARLALRRRQQVLYRQVYRRQKAAAMCIEGILSAVLEQRKLARKKELCARMVEERVVWERELFRCALVISRYAKAFLCRRRRERELLGLLALRSVEELKLTEAAATIVSRWWKIIPARKAYWRRRSKEVEEQRREEELRQRQIRASIEIQRRFRGILGRKEARMERQRKVEEHRLRQRRLHDNTDLVRLCLQEYSYRCKRLKREAEQRLVRQEEAAAVIQQGWKAALQRQIVNNALARCHRVVRAVLTIQRAYRLFCAGREIRYLRRVEQAMTRDRLDNEYRIFRATMTLQCFARMVVAKRAARRRRAAVGRGYFFAAVAIQSACRGLTARAQLGWALLLKRMAAAELAANIKKQKERIAAVTAAFLRARESCVLAEGRRCRRLTEKLFIRRYVRRELLRDKSAAIIQRAVRRWLRRRRQREEEERARALRALVLLSVVRIQSLVRGFLARKEFRLRRYLSQRQQQKREEMEEVMLQLWVDEWRAGVLQAEHDRRRIEARETKYRESLELRYKLGILKLAKATLEGGREVEWIDEDEYDECGRSLSTYRDDP